MTSIPTVLGGKNSKGFCHAGHRLLRSVSSHRLSKDGDTQSTEVAMMPGDVTIVSESDHPVTRLPVDVRC
ncbi:MAG: hypothetical protein GDA48_11945, partial [Hormoscilla sp. GM102CHS1]|nr:hypothetical protein [Hormoscilla sp. GM102CHS1]